jgi:hypothetical protein
MCLDSRRERQIPRSTVHDVLHKRLRLRAYKIQMILALKPSDHVARTNVAVHMLERIDAAPDFLRQVSFSDEATFHVSGVVNRYNCKIWGSQNPHVTCELERCSPKELPSTVNHLSKEKLCALCFCFTCHSNPSRVIPINSEFLSGSISGITCHTLHFLKRSCIRH